jgi:serine/threonine-protein kinase PRP4
LLALGLLAKLRIVHSDVKPHNILVGSNFNVLKLADFGSAFSADDADADPTPYVGSRFYRAPETILCARHTPAIDVWAAACVLFELFTGAPLFAGLDNNDMLARHQALCGRFPQKMVRKSIAAATALGVEVHFEADSRFRRAVVDPVSREPGVRLETIAEAPTESLFSKLWAKRAEGDDKRSIGVFADLLEQMLRLDPARRPSVAEALGHPFLQQQHQQKRGAPPPPPPP